MMMLYAVDPGFGDTKGWSDATDHSTTPLLFPSIIAPSPANTVGSFGRQPLIINETAWEYGRPAQHLPGAIMPTKQERLTDPAVKALLVAALWELGAQGSIALATGIPLGLFQQEREATAKALLHTRWHVQRGEEKRSLTIDHIDLYPQGVAALIAVRPDARRQGLWPTVGYVAAVDIGFGTMDVLVVDAETSEVIPALSRSFPLGVGDVAAQFAQSLESVVHHMVPQTVALEALRSGRLRVAGTEYGVQEERDAALEHWRRQLTTTLWQFWREDQRNAFQFMIAVGGAAALFAEAIRPTFQNVWVPEHPNFANVRGYYHIGSRKMRMRVS